MNTPHDDEAWIDRAKALLDESAENLDAATLSRLNRARQAALAQRQRASAPLGRRRGAGRRRGRGVRDRDRPASSASTRRVATPLRR